VDNWFERMRADVTLDQKLLAELERVFASTDGKGAVDRESLLKAMKAAQTSR
jgi:hypothetical protein